MRLLCLSCTQGMSGLFVGTIAPLPVLILAMSGLGLLGAQDLAASTLVKVSHGLIPQQGGHMGCSLPHDKH